MILWANLLTWRWISAPFLKNWRFYYKRASLAFNYSVFTLGTLYSWISFAGNPWFWLVGNFIFTGFGHPPRHLNLSFVWVSAVNYSRGIYSIWGINDSSGPLAFDFFLFFFFFFFFFFYPLAASSFLFSSPSESSPLSSPY